MLETDASAQGLGAVLGQYQEDRKLHPISFASRALSPAEKHYGLTELETLAVVWAIFPLFVWQHSDCLYGPHGSKGNTGNTQPQW